MEEVMNVLKGWEVIPEVKVISQFFDHPLCLSSLCVKSAENIWPKNILTIIYLVIMACLSTRLLSLPVMNYCRLGEWVFGLRITAKINIAIGPSVLRQRVYWSRSWV